MKRIFLFCLLLCLVLTACGTDDKPKASVTIPGATTKIKVPSVAPEEEDAPLEDEDVDTEEEDTTTTDDEHRPVTKRTTKKTTKKTASTTKKATTATRYDGVTNARDVEPYPLPVANPDKEIYNKPEGSLIGTFDTVGYFTVVAEAKDSRGYTWGRLSDGGWTLVYFDVLPEITLCLTDGRFDTMLSINGKGEFTGYSGYYRYASNTDSDDGGGARCDFEGTFAITDIDYSSVTLKLTGLTVEEGATMEPYGLFKDDVYTLYLTDVDGNYRLCHEELGYTFYEYTL